MEDEILYIEIKDEKIIVHTMNGIIEGSLTDQLESILLHHGFERLHGSTIVNMSNIISYNKGNLIMKDGSKIKVSKRNIYKIHKYLGK